MYFESLAPNAICDFRAQFFERKDTVRDPSPDNVARHSPHDRGRLILCDDLSACGIDVLASAEPVLSHTRHDDRESVDPIDFRNGSEQDISGWPTRIHW